MSACNTWQFPSMLTISNSRVYLWSIKKGQQQIKNIIYHNVRFFYYITIATKSKRNQNFVHAKCHTTVKYQISFNQLAVTVHIKVALADKKRNHTNKFNSPLTESLMWQRSHLVPRQVHELRYSLGTNVDTPFFNYPGQKHCTRAFEWVMCPSMHIVLFVHIANYASFVPVERRKLLAIVNDKITA